MRLIINTRDLGEFSARLGYSQIGGKSFANALGDQLDKYEEVARIIHDFWVEATPNPANSTAQIYENTGELAASTEVIPSRSGNTITMRVRQDVRSKPDKAGNWGGWLVSMLVVKGHGPLMPHDIRRTMNFTGRATAKFPDGNYRLKYVRPLGANPYPVRAMERAKPEINAAVWLWTQAAARQGMEGLR